MPHVAQCPVPSSTTCLHAYVARLGLLPSTPGAPTQTVPLHAYSACSVLEDAFTYWLKRACEL
jgi:hypothetical protein